MRSLVDLLLPPCCVGCGAKPSPPFCEECAFLVEALPQWRCPICAGPIPPPIEPHRLDDPRPCKACASSPPPFREVAAPFVYGGPVASAIHRLKYRGFRDVVGRLGGELALAAEPFLAEADRIVPIPIHGKRRRRRGFDQAILLAREVSRRTGRPLAPTLLIRQREGIDQVGQSREARRANMIGAFQARRCVEGQSLLLVDDVMTTGSTAGAAAGALLERGAREVRVLALARAL